MVERTFSRTGSGELDTTGHEYVAPVEPANPFGAVNLDAVGSGASGGSGGSSTAGSGGGDNFTFDPDRHIGRDRVNSDGSYRVKRGFGGGNSRPAPSSQRSKARASNSASLDAFSNMLVVVHAGLASLTKIKELEIDESEGKSLATAVDNVLTEFDIKPDPKTQAIVQLVIAGSMVYGPRAGLYMARVKQEKRERKAQNITPGEGNVIFPFAPPSGDYQA